MAQTEEKNNHGDQPTGNAIGSNFIIDCIGGCGNTASCNASSNNTGKWLYCCQSCWNNKYQKLHDNRGDELQQTHEPMACTHRRVDPIRLKEYTIHDCSNQDRPYYCVSIRGIQKRIVYGKRLTKQQAFDQITQFRDNLLLKEASEKIGQITEQLDTYMSGNTDYTAQIGRIFN